MAKVAFIQYLCMHLLGPMNLSAVLKKNGHRCTVAIGTHRNILHKLDKEKPDIIAFSSTVNERRWLIYMAGQIKEKFDKNIPIIVGGALATFSPDIIETSSIDMICIGEGEHAIVELANAIDTFSDRTKIKNLWVKDGQRIFRNDLRPLIDDLNEMPFPDRDLYRAYPFIQHEPSARVMVTRGCPYSCSFCFEASHRKLYGKEGYNLRRRTVANVIEELILIKGKYGKKRIWFIDDLFPLYDKQWLEEFLVLYKSEVAIPFICHIRVELLDEETIKMLKDNGCCEGISFGVEAGNESYRNDILKKSTRNDEVRKIADVLKQHKLSFFTSNMIGLPGEQVEDALLTVKLNNEIRPDFSVCTVYQPLPQTELSEFALRQGYIGTEVFSRIPISSHERSLLKQKDIKKLINLHKFFYILLYAPCLEPIVKLLISFPNNIFYNILYKISYLIFYVRKVYKAKAGRLLEEALISFRYYRDKR